MDNISIYLDFQSANEFDNLDQYFHSPRFRDQSNKFDENSVITPKKIKLDNQGFQAETQKPKQFQSNLGKQLKQIDTLNDFSNNFYMNRSIPIENIRVKIKNKKLIKVDSKKINQLALRNLKLNLGTGLNQFIQYKKNISLQNKDYNYYHKLSDLNNFVSLKLNKVRSALGWLELWENPIYGKFLREQSLLFFGKSYAQSYILNSKIKPEYKKYYLKQIKMFHQGAININKFNLRQKSKSK